MPEFHRHLNVHRGRAARRIGVLVAVTAMICAWLTVVTTSPASADGEPQVTVDDITVYEPHADESGAMPFTVALEFPATSELTIPWQFYRGKPSWVPNVQASGQLVFAPGETTRTLSFPLAFDPTDNTAPYYYTVQISPGWRNVDQYGVATVHDTTRDGEFVCDATAYETFGVSPPAIRGDDCKAGFRQENAASYDGAHLTLAESTLQVVQYADNSAYTQPSVGDGGEAHVSLSGVVWRIAPGLVLRAASVTADARIVCTALGALPLMESSSTVTGLRINGSPPLGTITEELVIYAGNGVRIVLNEHQDQSVIIAGGPDKGESHRTIMQSAIAVHAPLTYAYVARTYIGQLWGNPCNS
jgi:hypothetical protein